MDSFELSETELACGLTLEAVQLARREDALVRKTADGIRVICAPDTPPALAGAVARMALGVRCDFVGLNHGRGLVYAPAESL